jgi:hypothetical protein
MQSILLYERGIFFVSEIKKEWDKFATYDFFIESLTDFLSPYIMSKGNACHLLTQHNHYTFCNIDPQEGINLGTSYT